ncbi:ChbG/HpnK family deacetylase [Orrella sp. 11846]|uniref:ChbG/HpnK family deacetylase n=1 Tax=Orrella sp. 11846 TaxID=3409913 RepID=UPI003B5A7895
MSKQRVNHAGQQTILICADDYGLHADVDAAIVDLGERGRLSVTSVLVDAAILHRERVMALQNSPLSAGLHFNLTEKVGDLTHEDVQPLGRLIMRSYLGQVPHTWLQKTIDRQLDLYESLFDAPPTYVDGHQHVHQLPGVRQLLLQTLFKRYGNRKPWLRSTCAVSGLWRAGLRDALKAKVIETLGAHQFVKQAKAVGFLCNQGFAGVYDFVRPSAPFEVLMQKWLDCAKQGTLLMTHPSRAPIQNDPVGIARQREYEVLGSAAFVDWLAQRQLNLYQGTDVRAVIDD